MKCLYFLASSLSCTQDVSDDLHQAGVSDFYLHVISRDESGLKKQQIHSSNYLETLDVIRDGFIGALEQILEEAETDPEFVKNAPYTTPVRRLDEAAAARNPVVTQDLDLLA